MYVLMSYPNYVTWARFQANPSGQLADFLQWVDNQPFSSASVSSAAAMQTATADTRFKFGKHYCMERALWK